MADQQILNPELSEWFEGLMKGGLTATKAVSVYEEFVFGGKKAGDVELSSQVLCVFISQRFIGTYPNAKFFYIVQSQTMGTQAMSYRPPPIPDSIRLTFKPESWHQFPRWYPTLHILRSIEQQTRSSVQLSDDDAESVYKHCKRLSGGLESGQMRNYADGISESVCILFYQKQVCKCHATQSSSCSTKEKKVCYASRECVPFIVIVQEGWQRKFAFESRLLMRILFMDETHGVNQWRWPLTVLSPPPPHTHTPPEP